MQQFHAVYKPTAHKLSLIQPFGLADLGDLFLIKLEASMENTHNIRIGEKYPITVKVEPATIEYNDFTINDDSEVKVYNALGGKVNVNGEIKIDNNLKTVTFIWDTSPTSNPTIFNSPQQYTIIIWVSISYGEVVNTLIASDNITKNLIRSSKLE